jgi:hypothetical protein
MRISISGSHLVGKTTLAEALAKALPQYEIVPEPYYLLVEDGVLFEEMPSIEDFELQLERSFQSLHGSGTDVIFDRCPLDILGYLITHQDADSFRISDWFSRIQESIATLDLIVFVPIENPDRIAVPRSQVRLRAEVDSVLRDIIIDDAYGLGVEAITASGILENRVRQVIEHIR